MKRFHIYVSGNVQGVGFRYFVNKLATEMGLAGWVRNADSRVEIDIQGDEADLEKFKTRLKSEKPRLSSVTDLEITELKPLGVSTFTILASV
jgi:hydrogenase maturation protein HypF